MDPKNGLSLNKSSDLSKFIDVIYSEKTGLKETQVPENSFSEPLEDLGLNISVNFEKTNFEFDEEKSVLDALNTGDRKASSILDLLSTPVEELKGSKGKILQIFKDLFIHIGIWDSNSNTFLSDGEINPEDLKIKNKILDLTLIKAIVYLAELGKIDERFKNWWRRFLNQYVEKLDKIVTFKIQESALKQKGLYLWVFDKTIHYVGIASADYARTLKNEYGGLKGYQCTLNGNVTRCKLNSEVQSALQRGEEVEYWIAPFTDTELNSIYKNNEEILQNFIKDSGKKSFGQQSLEVIESCLIYKFNTLKPNGINGNYSKKDVGQILKSQGTLIPEEYNSSNLQNMEEINRLQELAGIPKQYQILYRIDSALEKLGIEDGDEIESGSEEWVELLSIIYQVPFEGDIEVFSQQIDAKAKKLNFPVYKLENNLDIRDIEII